MSSWLVTGAGGMLGQDLVRALERDGHTVAPFSRSRLDITDRNAVTDAILGTAPDVVVNCAAWTDVDGAEEAEDQARRVNGDGTAVVADACAASGARLLHLSTDYVFPGNGSAPYREDASPDPINAYGRTKLAGEAAVLRALPDTGYVVRTAWLYGEHGNSFVRTMVRLESEREELDVVDDQQGQPTWTADLAAQLVRLGESGAPAGVYHGTNAGITTWHGLAQEIFRQLGADPARVRPTTSDAYRRPAPRPAYSVLGHDAWAAAGMAPLRDWRTALAQALPQLLASWRPPGVRSA